jgi:hypothetical protein
MADLPPNRGEDLALGSLIRHWRMRAALNVPVGEESRIIDPITTRLVRSEGIPAEWTTTPDILIQATIVVRRTNRWRSQKGRMARGGADAAEW